VAATGGLCSIPRRVLGQDASKPAVVVGILNNGRPSHPILPPNPTMAQRLLIPPRRPSPRDLAIPFGATSTSEVEGVIVEVTSAAYYGRLQFVDGQGYDMETFAARFGELARHKPAVVVTVGTLATVTAAQATPSTPIVMVGVADPVGLKIVQSLSRPGGNVTGVSLLGPELLEKSLDFLLEARPSIQHLAVLWNLGNPGAALALRHLEQVVKSRRLNFVSAPIQSGAELEARLDDLGQLKHEALMVVNDPFLLEAAP
jgi:ABC-type uncharacterized transport system substrate-binding protein